MNFTEYRSKCIKKLWKIFEADYVCRLPGFSTWRIDDICANHWKHEYSIKLCVEQLTEYLKNDVLTKPIEG